MKSAFFKIRNFFIENQIFNFTKNSKIFMFMSICLILGVVLGSIAAGCVNFDLMEKINFTFKSDFIEIMSKKTVDIFVSSLVNYFIFLVLIELSALSVWGILSVPLILIFKGVGIGMCSGYLYLVYSLKGIAFYILILMPGVFVSSLTMVLYSVEAFGFSFNLLKKFLNYDASKLFFYGHHPLNSHFRKLAYSLLMLCLSSVVDLCFIKMFSIFFHF